ncbi:Ser/Thr protein phosphatase superfamily [Aspergillus stella-maris]|uniref:Ser/Thr protein phosphatase superfamily n=1 Tax=Aspergillus stella-maris TaxID=1810926 RepID=UPI003CCDDEBB
MSSTSIQIVSDLHLETPAAYDVFEITPNAPYLALLGDIGYVKDDGYFEFLRKQLTAFEIVFLVLGNHEAYNSTWHEARLRVHRFSEDINKSTTQEKAFGKFVLLDQTRYDVSPTKTILGCTLFSRVTEEQHDWVSFGLNDFYRIKDWTVEDHNEAHCADLAWSNQQVESISRLEPERRIVVFTHHSPVTHKGAVDPRHATSNISSGFMSDLSGEECWMNQSVKLWAFGHTHFNCDYKDETSENRVVTNQRGYYFAQSAGFECGKVIDIGNA